MIRISIILAILIFVCFPLGAQDRSKKVSISFENLTIQQVLNELEEKAGEWAIANAADLSCRTLLLHGTADRIIDYRGTEAFHENADMSILALFEGGYHELHHDLCRNEALDKIGDWFKRSLET